MVICGEFWLFGFTGQGAESLLPPVIFIAVSVENGFFTYVVLAECFTDICLVFGRKVGFFAVETVVFAPAEVGDELVFQCVQVFVGNVVEQVADSPCHMYFLYRLEVGA